jgi:hypothetical protein
MASCRRPVVLARSAVVASVDTRQWLSSNRVAVVETNRVAVVDPKKKAAGTRRHRPLSEADLLPYQLIRDTIWIVRAVLLPDRPVTR